MRSSRRAEASGSESLVAQAVPGLGSFKYILKSMRPRQWTKNGFVFLPLLFTTGQYWHLFRPSMWNMLAETAGAFAIFCLLSGLIYIVNDLVDVEKDRAHPRKRLRPIASGLLARRTAIAAVVVILAVALALSTLLDLVSASLPYPTGSPVLPFPYPFTLVAIIYVVLQFAYSYSLKNMVIIDVFAIAAGFLLRAVAGAVVIQVPISPWLYVVTMLLALFIGFGKRRNELLLLEGSAAYHRAILREYTADLLDQILSITAASTVIAYSLYTFSAENLPRNHAMMLTIPFALYGIFRYLYLIHVKNEGGSPEEILLRDRPFLAAAIIWGVTVAAILYFFGRPS